MAEVWRLGVGDLAQCGQQGFYGVVHPHVVCIPTGVVEGLGFLTGFHFGQDVYSPKYIQRQGDILHKVLLSFFTPKA